MGKEWVLMYDPNTPGKLIKAGRQGRVLPTHPSHFPQVSLSITLVSEWENFDLKSQKSWDKQSKAHGRIFIVIPLLLPKAPTSIILSNAQGSLLWGWDHFIFWLAGHVTISNHSCAFLLKPNLTFPLVESPTLHTLNFLIPEGRPKWEDPGQAHWMLCCLWSLTKSSRENAAWSSIAKDVAPLDPKTNKPGRLWTCWRSLWTYKV